MVAHITDLARKEPQVPMDNRVESERKEDGPHDMEAVGVSALADREEHGRTERDENARNKGAEGN